MVEPPSIDNLIGTTLGSYRLEQLIERRALAPVFLARNIATGTMYRLRILIVPADLPSEKRIVYLGHFQQQANSIAELQHFYILPLLDYGNHAGIPYLVSPHFPMRSLSAQLQNGPMDLILISRYLDQITAVLEYAHEHAILHRNLTTDCVFVKQDGNLVVADFGLLRMLELSKPDAKSDPLYGMNEFSSPAPEQCLGRPVDTYTDVYALGAVLYRLLTGHRVFRGQTLKEIADQHVLAPVPTVGMWRKGLPATLDSIIVRAMRKEPAERFRHPGELANVYHQVVAPNDKMRKPFVIAPPPPAEALPTGDNKAALLPSAPPSPLRTSSAPRRPTRISRRRALTLLAAGGGGAVAVAAVALVASHFLGSSASPTVQSAAQTTNAPGHSGTVVARTVDVPLNSARQIPNPNGGSGNPGLLIHLSNNHFVAFDSTCTHAGCAVSYNSHDKLLECPCHGAKFDPARNAAVVAGPAPTPLAPIKITVNADGTITEG